MNNEKPKTSTLTTAPKPRNPLTNRTRFMGTIKSLASNLPHLHKGWRYYSATMLALSLCLGTATASLAKSYSFSWQANPESGVAYKLYYKKGGTGITPTVPFNGTEAAEGVSPIDVGNQTTFTVNNLDDNSIYHFTLTAYNDTGESEYTTVVTVGSKPVIKIIQAK